MKPVIQRNRHKPEEGIKGDCLRACICSLLELSDENVPNFVEKETWREDVAEFLASNGYEMECYNRRPLAYGGYYMAIGISPRGFPHAVIHKMGKLVHDPHPDGGGVESITDYCILVKISPEVTP